MRSHPTSLWRQFDFLLFAITIILTIFGVLMIRSATLDAIDPDLIARNATLVLRFDDLLDDGALAEALLPETVKVLGDYPPQTPLEPRLVFDQNFGGVVNGQFHSTRILIDTTVSEQEAQSGANAPINNLGLPASLENNDSPNIAVRIPTRTDPGSGQFEILRNLGGASLST
ncbi:MAG: hypothetical protein KC519_03710, partial [Anaerolineae bacterium]|nr:hypothetical protein [Anaerolineae bacterium]